MLVLRIGKREETHCTWAVQRLGRHCREFQRWEARCSREYLVLCRHCDVRPNVREGNEISPPNSPRCSPSSACVRSVRQPPVRSDKVTIVAFWLTLEVILVLRLGFPKRTSRCHFGHHPIRPAARGIDIHDGVFCNPLLFVTHVKDSRTIARSDVVALTIQRGRVMNLKEEFQKLPVTELTRIKDNLDCFGVGSVISIGRVGYVSAGIAYTRGNHARKAAQQM